MHPQRTPAPRRLIVLLAAIGVLTAMPATASALGIQDDETLKYDPASFLARADTVHADWVRLMIPYDRWHNGEAGAYINAARAAHDSGRRVLATLMSWNDYPTPDQWAGFAREVEPQLRGYVDAWSVMNEPNWPAMAPRTTTTCVVSNDPSVNPVSSTVRRGVRIEYRYRRSSRGRYIRRRHHHRTRYVKASASQLRHHKRFRRVTRRVALSKPRTVLVTTAAERRTCSAEAVGVAYRRVWDRTAPILSGGMLVAGDLAPGETSAVMDAFFSLGPLAVKPDVLGTHYSTAPEMASEVTYARAHGMRAWETEWAWGSQASGADWLARYEALKDAGAEQVFIYDTRGTGWNTKMPADAVEAFAENP